MKNTQLSLSYSVVTVCLNSARTIGRTIDSVLRQGPLPAEYIFVDGGSSDATTAIINHSVDGAVAKGLSTRFVTLNQTGRRGITAAWNIALARCTSDLVFILNSDDWYDEDCAQRIIEAFNAHPKAEIVFANTTNYKRESATPCGISRNRPQWTFPFMMPFVHPACFVRRPLYKNIGFFDTRYSLLADYDFLYRCMLQCVNYVIVDEALVNFELGGSANSNRPLARWEMFQIGRRHCRVPLIPHLALLLRTIIGK